MPPLIQHKHSFGEPGHHQDLELRPVHTLLKKQYGPGSVIHLRLSNTIVVFLKPTGASVSLTIEQAKFLAANPISLQDLVDRKSGSGDDGL
jgi:hypothetical protein